MKNMFRWVVEKNKVSGAQIREYREQNGTSLAQAKFDLENEKGPTLQYWEIYDQFGNGFWVDVPTVLKYRDK